MWSMDPLPRLSTLVDPLPLSIDNNNADFVSPSFAPLLDPPQQKTVLQ